MPTGCIRSWIGLICVIIVIKCVCGSEDEFRLIRDLKENYNPVERPVADHFKAVTVHLRLILQQIVDIDEKNQILEVVVWTEYRWKDYKIRWNPEEYGNLTEIRLPPNDLWKPDVLLFTSANENFDARFPVNFVVQHDGRVMFAPPSIIRSSCRIDMTWFPFDEQICFLKYGSWTYTAKELDLYIDDTALDEKNKMDLTYFVPNGEWDLLSTPARRVWTEFAGSEYVELYFYLHLRRRAMYYGLNWIIPSVLITFSNVLGFTMPPECGEKITLQITNLLSVTVFLGIVADVTPPTSESVPIIAAFFSVSMIILGASICFTLVIINIFFRSPRTHTMNNQTRTIFLEWLPWLLLMNRPGKQFRKLDTLLGDRNDVVVVAEKPETRRSDVSAGRMVRGESMTSLARIRPILTPNETILRKNKGQNGAIVVNLLKKAEAGKVSPCYCNIDAASTAASSSTLDSIELMFRETLRELCDYIRLRRQLLQEEEEEQDLQADWKYMAMVLDRLCLYLFSFCAVASLILIFIATPNSQPVTI